MPPFVPFMSPLLECADICPAYFGWLSFLHKKLQYIPNKCIDTYISTDDSGCKQEGTVCFRQKQQILQLHARIRENELRAQQVLQSHRGWSEDDHILNTKVTHL